MKEGQTLLENMSERTGDKDSEESFRFLQNVNFSSFMKSSGNDGIYVADIQGFAVLSKSKLLFDRFNTEVSLGNSLGMNKLKMRQLYGGLPKAVLHRAYGKNATHLTISAAGDQWVTAEYESEKHKELANDGDLRGYFSMNPSEKISSFYAYAGRGNTFLITESNKWIRYSQHLVDLKESRKNAIESFSSFSN